MVLCTELSEIILKFEEALGQEKLISGSGNSYKREKDDDFVSNRHPQTW